jgi:aldose 1-epimerase
MFELQTTPWGPYRRYDFTHEHIRHGFSVVPERGATLLELRYKGENWLDGYTTPEELDAGRDAKGALLFPFPNRLRHGQYNWLGQEYRFPVNDPKTQTAIHGFVRQEAFSVSRIELTDEHAEISCRVDYDGHYAGYPFPFSLEVTYSLTYRGLFGLCLWVKNRHSTSIPVGFGWHPYFRLAESVDECLLRCPPCSRELLDENRLPVLKREPYTLFEQPQRLNAASLDDCFRVADELTLYDIQVKGRHRTITLSLSRALFPFFQLFTPDHRESIAVEPMSCLINAFENGQGLVALPPGASWSGAFVLQCADA